jgi:hypothetical protein
MAVRLWDFLTLTPGSDLGNAGPYTTKPSIADTDALSLHLRSGSPATMRLALTGGGSEVSGHLGTWQERLVADD